MIKSRPVRWIPDLSGIVALTYLGAAVVGVAIAGGAWYFESRVWMWRGLVLTMPAAGFLLWLGCILLLAGVLNVLIRAVRLGAHIFSAFTRSHH